MRRGLRRDDDDNVGKADEVGRTAPMRRGLRREAGVVSRVVPFDGWKDCPDEKGVETNLLGLTRAEIHHGLEGLPR
jgi:hypothetical protein